MKAEDVLLPINAIERGLTRLWHCCLSRDCINISGWSVLYDALLFELVGRRVQMRRSEPRVKLLLEANEK